MPHSYSSNQVNLNMLNKIISFFFTRTTNNNEGSASERNVAPPLHKNKLEPHLSNQNVVRETKD
ncbi:hypothetical protein VcTj87_01260 [Vibrio comitans]